MVYLQSGLYLAKTGMLPTNVVSSSAIKFELVKVSLHNLKRLSDSDTV